MQTTILTDLVQRFLAATASWHGALLPIAESLFLTLAAIQLAWSAAWWVLGEEDPAAIWVLLLRRILSLGFFWAVLVNANVWVPAVIEGFVEAGRRAASAAGASVVAAASAGASVVAAGSAAGAASSAAAGASSGAVVVWPQAATPKARAAAAAAAMLSLNFVIGSTPRLSVRGSPQRRRRFHAKD